MVRNGWALAYRQFSLDYVEQEQQARATEAGMWMSVFVPPWEWRQRRREGAGRRPELPNDRDCSDFASWDDAQQFYEAEGGPERDPHRLDSDQDGIACEALQ